MVRGGDGVAWGEGEFFLFRPSSARYILKWGRPRRIKFTRVSIISIERDRIDASSKKISEILHL